MTKFSIWFTQREQHTLSRRHTSLSAETFHEPVHRVEDLEDPADVVDLRDRARLLLGVLEVAPAHEPRLTLAQHANKIREGALGQDRVVFEV